MTKSRAAMIKLEPLNLPHVGTRELEFGNHGRPQQVALLFGALDKFVELVVELTDSRFRIFRLGHFGRPFAFGRSTRSSLNSGGPLVRRRRRLVRSSSATAGSSFRSIVCAAISDVRAACLRALGFSLGWFDTMTSTASSVARIASGRVIGAFCLAIQASTAESRSGCKRTPTRVPLPVGAGPRRFFGITVRRFIITVLTRKQAERKLKSTARPDMRSRN